MQKLSCKKGFSFEAEARVLSAWPESKEGHFHGFRTVGGWVGCAVRMRPETDRFFMSAALEETELPQKDRRAARKAGPRNGKLTEVVCLTWDRK